MDVLPPRELVASIRHWRIPGDLLDVVPPMFVRAAWKACVAAQYSEDGIDAFVATELIPLAQWFFMCGSYRHLEPGQMKVGWPNLLRLRRESVLMEAKQLGIDDWPPIVRRYESGGFETLALSHKGQPEEEGSAMQHCVGSYADHSRFEPLRIFSVRTRKTKQRVATLSLMKNNRATGTLTSQRVPKMPLWTAVYGRKPMVCAE